MLYGKRVSFKTPTAHIHWTCGVQAFTDQSCFVAQGGPSQYQTGVFNVKAYGCTFESVRQQHKYNNKFALSGTFNNKQQHSTAENTRAKQQQMLSDIKVTTKH